MNPPSEHICALWPDCQALTDEGHELCPRHEAVAARPTPGQLVKQDSDRHAHVLVAKDGGRVTLHRVHCATLLRVGAKCWRGQILPLPGTVHVKLCAVCRPSEDEIRSRPPEVEWDKFPVRTGLPTPQRVPLDMAEDMLAGGVRRRFEPRWAS